MRTPTLDRDSHLCRFALTGMLILLVEPGSARADDLAKYYQPNRCGPIALYAVCRAYRIETTIAELADLSASDENGTTIAGLVDAAEANGLVAKAYLSSIRHLQRLEGPAIIDFPRGHFCVLFAWKDGKAWILDPPRPTRLVSSAELQKQWNQHVIVFSAPRQGKRGS